MGCLGEKALAEKGIGLSGLGRTKSWKIEGKRDLNMCMVLHDSHSV